jgi:hypothetical protein
LYGEQDVDLYAVYLNPGEKLSVDVDAWYLDDGTRLSDLDSCLRILDENGTELYANHDGVSADDYGSYGNEYDNADHDAYVGFTAA